MGGTHHYVWREVQKYNTGSFRMGMRILKFSTRPRMAWHGMAWHGCRWTTGSLSFNAGWIVWARWWIFSIVGNHAQVWIRIHSDHASRTLMMLWGACEVVNSLLCDVVQDSEGGTMTYEQRYFICDRFWKKGADGKRGPIFAYIGNEADVELWVF